MKGNRDVAFVLLCAGGSTRFGAPKQLALVNGEKLVDRALRIARATQCNSIVVVLGAQASVIRTQINADVRICDNPNWEKGIGTSIRAGIEMVRDKAAAILALPDQPLIPSSHFDQLIECHGQTRLPIVASEYSGTLGVPALFSNDVFPELLALADHSGAKAVVLKDRARVAAVSCREAAIDIDTPEDLRKLTC